MLKLLHGGDKLEDEFGCPPLSLRGPPSLLDLQPPSKFALVLRVGCVGSHADPGLLQPKAIKKPAISRFDEFREKNLAV